MDPLNVNPFARTEIEIPLAKYPIGTSSHVYCIGSCFTQLLGTRLRQYKFDTLVQPFGTLFNPITLCQLLYAQPEEIIKHSFIHQGTALNYKLNSNPFAAATIGELNQQIAEAADRSHSYLKLATHVVITLGSAHVFYLKGSLEPVSNCHQLPASNFTRRLLTVAEVAAELGKMIEFVLSQNPDLKLIFTVSPVRHGRENLIENSVSKSVLRVAVDEICSQHAAADYFPAFELLIDDLRDYRFYANDLLHPAPQAEAYIWEKFCKSWLTKEATYQITALEEVFTSLNHRPRFPYAQAWVMFKENLKQKLEGLPSTLNLEKEWAAFNELP